jgi:hypothetical protein
MPHHRHTLASPEAQAHRARSLAAYRAAVAQGDPDRIEASVAAIFGSWVRAGDIADRRPPPTAWDRIMEDDHD